jgi:hypothetical protein
MARELKEWVKQEYFADKPWLLFGKGPTFSKRSEFDLQGFNKFSLNHVVREQKVEVAHIIDIDVVEACSDAIPTNCDWLIVPRILNVRYAPSKYLTLTDWCTCLPVLAEMEKRGRLVTYDFSHMDNDDMWTVVARYFSSEAALGILGRMGVKKIRSLGIDGGTSYSQVFDDLKQTLLVNGQQSFDLQFDRLREIAEQFQIDYAPLAKPEQMAPSLSPTAAAPGVQTAASVPRAASMDATKPTNPTNSPNPTSVPNPISTAAPTSANDQTASGFSLPTKLQNMEQEIRDLRSALQATKDELQSTCKELTIVSDRLGWARDEIAEYRERVLSMEKNLHTLYKSKTWKLGRVFTKPGDVLKKGLHKS